MNAKTKNIIAWVLAGLLAAEFLMFGGMKVFGGAESEVAQNFTKWGYPSWFMILTGILEIAGAIGVLLPKFRKWAALGLMGLLVGAIATHLMNGEAGALAMPLIPLILAAGLYWLRKDDGKVETVNETAKVVS